MPNHGNSSLTATQEANNLEKRNRRKKKRKEKKGMRRRREIGLKGYLLLKIKSQESRVIGYGGVSAI